MSGRVLSFDSSPHRRTQELLPWFLNGTLEGGEADEVSQHLKECPACHAELESLRVLRSAYVESDLAPEAEAALSRLRPRLQPREAARPAPWRILLSPGPIAAWTKFALAAQFGVIFALGWVVLLPDREGLAYHTLAEATAPARAAGSLVVVFDPAAAQRDVARILRSAGARIVDGPTEANGYVLAVPNEGLAAALTRLRGERAVMLAEPLQADKVP